MSNEMEEWEGNEESFDKCLMAMKYSTDVEQCLEDVFDFSMDMKSDDNDTFNLFLAFWKVPKSDFTDVKNLDKLANAYVVEGLSTDFISVIKEHLNNMGFECRLKG